MKRRSFISLAGWAAALGLPLVGKAAQSHMPAGSTVPASDGPPLKAQDRPAIIKVVGVGGAGGNVVEHMVRNGMQGLEYVCLNTDMQSCTSRSSTSPQFLRGLPGVDVSGEPKMGKEWALSSRCRIAEMLKGAHMVFITAGMGGGTGTGAAPVVAKVARQLGIRTAAVVTTPFAFEGKRVRRAKEGLLDLGQSVDSLIVFSNENVTKVTGEDISLFEVFRCADDAIKNVIVGIAENINALARTGIDFEDVRIVTCAINQAITDSGTAFGIGRGVDTEGKEITFRLSEVLEIHSLRTRLSL